MLRSRRFWLGLVGSIIFMGLFLYRTDLVAMLHALRGANYWLVIPGVACYFVALWFRTLRWQIILAPLGQVKLRRLWPVVTIGYMANNLLPVRLGELVRAYFLWDKERISKTAGLATILVERVFDGMALLLLAMLVSLVIPIAGLLQSLGTRTGVNWLVLTLALSIPFFVATALMVVVAWFPAGVERIMERAAVVLPRPARGRALDLARRFLSGLSVLRSPRRLFAIYLLSLPVWIAEAAMYMVIAFGFGLDLDFANWGLLGAAMMLTTVISNLGTSVPSTGGSVGPFEFFAAETLVILGVSRDGASAYVLVLHLALLAPVTLLGLFYLWSDNISLSRLAQKSQQAEPLAGPVEGVQGGEP
ncbi:MAG: flippase-like domain-containing protein [Chloroflexi bacterium]|nr:flippase-like domain-containing protein [Chloroflexota bacterium]